MGEVVVVVDFHRPKTYVLINKFLFKRRRPCYFLCSAGVERSRRRRRRRRRRHRRRRRRRRLVQGEELPFPGGVHRKDGGRTGTGGPFFT